MALRYAASASLWPACNAATSCSAARSVISLICSDFIFRSPVRGFGSLTSSRGTKEPRSQENGRKAPERKATGVTLGRKWRGGVPAEALTTEQKLRQIEPHAHRP